MTNSERFRASEDVVGREVGGEMVLLDLASGTYFGLGAVGSQVWQQLAEGEPTLGVSVVRTFGTGRGVN